MALAEHGQESCFCEDIARPSVQIHVVTENFAQPPPGQAWTLTRANIRRLEQFHQYSLRRIVRIKWFHKKTNYEVVTLADCKIETMQCMVEYAVLRWSGHVTRLNADRTPKLLLYGRLTTGRTSRGNHLTYRNQVRHILYACDIRPSAWSY